MLKLSKKISDIMFFGLVPLAVLSACPTNRRHA